MRCCFRHFLWEMSFPWVVAARWCFASFKKYFSLFSFHLSRMQTKNDEPYSLIRFEWNFKVGKVWNHSFAFANCAHTFIEKRFFIKREGFWCATKKHKSTERYRLSSSSSVRFQQIVLCKNTFTANLMHRKRKTPAIGVQNVYNTKRLSSKKKTQNKATVRN